MVKDAYSLKAVMKSEIDNCHLFHPL